MITMKTDLNENICQWKHLGKGICDFIKKEKDANLSDKLHEMSIDEITEFAVYDC